MSDSTAFVQSKIGLGDSAVDGLLAGVAAGIVMAVYLLAAGLLSGAGWRSTLAQFDPGGSGSALTGLLTHLAVAGVYGVAFGVAARGLGRLARRVPGWLAGLGYGAALWLLASFVTGMTARAGNGGWLNGIAPLHLALAHGAYGLTLGWLTGRRPRR